MPNIRAFLSHSSSDKPIVRKIKNELDKQGILTWFDEFQIGIGDSIRREIEDGIVSSNYLILFLSKAAVASEWVSREIDSAFIREIESKDTMIIPIILEDCNIPVSLKSKKYIDLRKNYANGVKSLIETLTYPRKSVLRAITGRWAGESGAMYLSSVGNLIMGKYDWHDLKAGNIFGHLEKNRIKFNWTWDLSEESGLGIFDIDETLQNLDGGWWFKKVKINPDTEISKLKKLKGFNLWSYKKDYQAGERESILNNLGYEIGLNYYKIDKPTYQKNTNEAIKEAIKLFEKAAKKYQPPKNSKTNNNKNKRKPR